MVDHQYPWLQGHFPAHDEFLQITARKRLRLRVRRALAHIKQFRDHPVDIPGGVAVDHAVAYNRAARHSIPRFEPCRFHRVMGQHNVFRQRKIWHRAMAQPLLGHKGGIAATPLGDALAPATDAGDFHRSVVGTGQLTGQGIKKFALSIARDAGDGNDLAGPDC